MLGLVLISQFAVAGDMTVSRESIKKVVTAHQKEISRCYADNDTGDSGKSGTVTFQWTILPSGEAIDVAAVPEKSTLNNKSIETCVAASIKGWKFQKPPKGASATVEYAIKFGKKKKR